MREGGRRVGEREKEGERDRVWVGGIEGGRKDERKKEK